MDRKNAITKATNKIISITIRRERRIVSSNAILLANATKMVND